MAPILYPLIAATLCFAALWPLSVRLRDASIADILWGPGFLIQLCVAQVLIGAPTAHGWILLIVVGIWSLRLGWVLSRRRLREEKEDSRYQLVRASWGQSFWWKSLFIIFVLQAFIQWLVALGPIWGVQAAPSPVGALAVIGVAAALYGFLIETVADAQLDTFKRNAPRHALLTTGLRSWVRHPSYLGEIVFWIGISLIVLDTGAWQGLLSPIVVTLLLTKVSGVPLLNESLAQSRRDFSDYKQRTPALLPLVRG